MRLSPLFFFCVLLGLSTGTRADLVVQDDNGQRIELKAFPQRIVSLAPHITELLFAAGAGSAIVGVSDYSDYPEAARRLPRVGGARLDVEAIAALRPDLIIAWADGTPASQQETLRTLGIPIYLSAPRRLADVADALEHLGTLTGHEATARNAAHQYRATLRRLRDSHAGRAAVRVFYQVWEQPLITLNGRHIISDALRTCGGENIFAHLPALAPNVGAEDVLSADPDVILASSPDGAPTHALDFWRRWPRLSAVRHQQLLFVHADWIDRAAPRLLLGVEEICRKLDQARSSR